jgi:short-subunit dehydrogenase
MSGSGNDEHGSRRVGLVTGASSGIGFAYAEMLAEEGYDLTIVARGAERLDTAAQRLRPLGVRVAARTADLSIEDQLVDVFAAHAAEFGRLDVLVNNVGFADARVITEMTAEFVDAHLRLNIRSLVLAYREAVPMLAKAAAETGSAFVFNVASIGALSGHPWLSMYTATKAAAVNFSKAMQKELIGRGIKSTAICPGYVDTPMTDPLKPHMAAETMIRPRDVVELTRPLLHLSAPCVVSELVIDRIRDEDANR